MAGKNGFLSWRNWASEHGDIEVSSSFVQFEQQAPAGNLLTPRTSQLAIAEEPGTVSFTVSWVQDSPQWGVPVRVVALLNHNIVSFVSASSFAITLFDADGGSYNPSGFPVSDLQLASGGGFQSNLFWIINPAIEAGGINLSRINAVTITVASNAVCGRYDPYSGRVEEEPFKCGGLWVGNGWFPERGIKFNGYEPGVLDPSSKIVEALDGTRYTAPTFRRRTGAFSLALVNEAEMLPTLEQPGGAPYRRVTAAPSLQAMIAHCGLTRPALFIPDVSSPGVVAGLGIHGYFDAMPRWPLLDRSHAGREYTVSLAMTETAG